MVLGSLSFIGLGLYDATDMSLKAQQTMQQSDQVFAEFYTSKLLGSSIEAIEEEINQKITVLNRSETEKGNELINMAKTNHVCFITGGDCMTATTHIDLRLQAIKQGIKTRVIHGSSIVSAVPGLLGLQHYKFGRTTTIAYPEKEYFPLSPYTVIFDNKKHNLHTLVLLDIQAEKNRYMTANEAMQFLQKMEEKKNQRLITDDLVIGVVGQAGSTQPTIRADTISNLIAEDFGPPLHTIVIPGNLHFMEIEAMEILAGLPSIVASKLQKI